MHSLESLAKHNADDDDILLAYWLFSSCQDSRREVHDADMVTPRRSLVRHVLNWKSVQQTWSEKQFSRRLRMSRHAFEALYKLLKVHGKHFPTKHNMCSNVVNRINIIEDRIKLAAVLRYLGGGTPADVEAIFGLSLNSFSPIFDRVIPDLICVLIKKNLSKHDFTDSIFLESLEKDFYSTLKARYNEEIAQIFRGCVGCVDGYVVYTEVRFKM
jgi:hypothetical protein